MSESTLVLQTLLTLFLLLLAAKVGGELAKKLGIAAVVGELLAGVLLAPTLLGGFQVFGTQLIVLNDPVQVFAQMGAILLLFLVGMETQFASFKKSGMLATVVAIGGVIVPFVFGYFLTIAWGYPYKEALLVGAALTATSIAITVKVLKDIGRCNTNESGILIGAAVIDDVLGLIVLAIVLGLLGGEGLNPMEISIIAIKSIGFWLAMTLFGVYVMARVINYLCPRNECGAHLNASTLPYITIDGDHCKLRCNGMQEASILAMCFGFAYVAGVAGLAPILGAFAAGMSVAETKIMYTIHEVTGKINFLMAPLFFVVIGAYVDLTGLTTGSLAFAFLLILLAMVGKIIGCSIPVLLINKDMRQAILVGIGMMSRGEVGLIIAGIGATSGIFSREVFSAVVLMVVITTIVTPIVLTEAYKRLSDGRSLVLSPQDIPDEDCSKV